MIEDKWKCLMILMKIGVVIDKKEMIMNTCKEITIEGEKIVIDFDGAPFWKYYVLQLYFLICHRKKLINYIDEASLNL